MKFCLFDQTCTLEELSKINGIDSVSKVVDAIFLILFDFYMTCWLKFYKFFCIIVIWSGNNVGDLIIVVMGDDKLWW